MYKIKSLFHTAWGSRKFSGKRLPGEEGIIALLTNMNRAQYTCPVTEAEFVTFLAQSMTGDALYVMNDFASRHRMGQISVQEIYTSLLNLYFSDMRPHTANQKLSDMTETNHPFMTLAEAESGIMKLSQLTAHSYITKSRQDSIVAEKYISTIMNILPKDCKVLVLGDQAKIKKRLRRDLEPHDLMEIVDNYRVPVDEHFRKVQLKMGNQAARVRRIEELSHQDGWSEFFPGDDNGENHTEITNQSSGNSDVASSSSTNRHTTPTVQVMWEP